MGRQWLRLPACRSTAAVSMAPADLGSSAGSFFSRRDTFSRMMGLFAAHQTHPVIPASARLPPTGLLLPMPAINLPPTTFPTVFPPLFHGSLFSTVNHLQFIVCFSINSPFIRLLPAGAASLDEKLVQTQQEVLSSQYLLLRLLKLLITKSGKMAFVSHNTRS